VHNGDRHQARLFMPALQRAPMGSRTSASGLVLPGIPSTAWMLGLSPVPGENTWIDKLARVYLVARDYLTPFHAARGRVFDRDQWIAVLLAKYPPEEYLCQLAALNHAANSDELTVAYQERFLDVVAADAADAIRRALAGGVDGQRRWFLARQVVLRAIGLVLIPPAPAGPAGQDPALAADLAEIDPESAAVLLVHLAADSLTQERRDGEPRFCGTAESLAMEMIANNLFNDRDDNGDLLGRYRLLWLRYGSRLTRFTPRRPPAEMLLEATGISFDDLTTLAFAYWAHIRSCGPGDQVKLNAMIMPGITISQATIEAFLGLFSSTPASLAAALRDCPKPWQMLPIQHRPLLRLGDDVVVLDERYLVERVTRGLYWLVHDHEKSAHGDKARNRWTQAYSEMIETRVEDQLRRMAPELIGSGQRAFFTEEDLQAAFPGDRNIDAGADFGGDVVLAEVVAGTVKLATREQADVTSFREDAERLVLGKARQLYVSAANLLRDPQPANSPLSVPAGRILPVVVCGGQFPVNPLTIRYISEQLAAEGLPPGGAIQPLTLLDLEELEGCQALHQRRGMTLPQLLDAWRKSPYAAVAFRNYLAYEYGGRELGRPADVQAALAESTELIQQRLGAAGTWSPPQNHDGGNRPVQAT
jgi:hypothetical protein